MIYLIDYHVHSNYSRGYNSISNLVEYASKKDLTIGIADQYSWHKYKGSKVTRNLDGYIEDLNCAHAEYRGILRGIEIDTTSIHRFTQFEQYSADLDFVFFEFVIDLAGNYSYDPKRRNRTLENLMEIVKFKKSTGITSFLSRPDFSLVLDHQLIENSLNIIEEHEIVIEINELHGNYYNRDFIDNVLDRDIKFCCGTSSTILDNIAQFPLVNAFVERFCISNDRIISIN